VGRGWFPRQLRPTVHLATLQDTQPTVVVTGGPYWKDQDMADMIDQDDLIDRLSR